MKTTELSYQEAISALHEGYMVKLPEWIGHWFADENGSIKVFTRAGDILNTPHYDHYNMRQDWEITYGLKGFDFAILALKAGKMVQREGWNGKGIYVFMRPADELDIDFIPKVKSLPDSVKNALVEQNIPGAKVPFNAYLCIKSVDGGIVNGWAPSQTDLLANDWHIV